MLAAGYCSLSRWCAVCNNVFHLFKRYDGIVSYLRSNCPVVSTGWRWTLSYTNSVRLAMLVQLYVRWINSCRADGDRPVPFRWQSMALSSAVTIAKKKEEKQKKRELKRCRNCLQGQSLHKWPAFAIWHRIIRRIPLTLGSAKKIISGGKTSGTPPTFVLTTCKLIGDKHDA